MEDMRWRTRLESLALETKYSLRTLSKSRAFTVIACLSLAIGIGATTAAFSVWDAVLLRSLGVREPDTLVLLTTRNAGSLRAMSHPSFTYLQERSSALEGLAAFRATPMNISATERTERVTGMLVSGNYFDVLGVRMALGAPIRPDDDRTPRTGGPRGPVAVLGYNFWRRRMSADPAIVGRVIRVNGQSVTVVGIAAPGFNGTTIGSIPAVYVPMMFSPHAFQFEGAWLENPRNLWLRTIGRVRRDVSLEQAQAELTLSFRRFHEDIVVPAANNSEPARRRAREASIVLVPGHAGLLELGDTVRPTVFALVGLGALVMLTACVNVAGLMVARAERLHRDTAICLALGASRLRLCSRTLTESLILGAAGIGLGVLLAAWIREVLAQVVAVNSALDLRMDRRVLGVALTSGLCATAIIGALTAWTQTRLGIVRALKGEDLSARLLLRKGLVVGQLAFSVVVLAVAALFTQTAAMLRSVDVGFDDQNIVVASLAPAGFSAERRRAFYARVLEDVRSLPGVVSAALASNEPLGVNTGWSIRARRSPGGELENGSASVMFVSPDYFRTMGIPLLRGRDFDPRDTGEASSPVIVNENFVRTYLTGVDPIGAQITGNGNMTFEIVGVVRDSAAFSLRDLDQQLMYVPGREGVLHVRSALPSPLLQAAIEDAIRRIDAEVPVFNVRTIEQVLDRFLVRERTLALLSSMFGLLALGLVAVGLYGVVANTVSRRTRELGIRLALGAGRARIVGLILREAAVLVVLGSAAGVPLVLVAGRLIAALLFGVQPLDALSLGAAIALLIAVAGMAAWLPARRAARVDPLLALRAE
jgi:predicted permease